MKKRIRVKSVEPHLDSIFGIPTTTCKLLKFLQTTYQLRHSGTHISSIEIYQPE
jgi:hypothetical protein